MKIRLVDSFERHCPDDSRCQDCKQRPWTAALWTTFGYVFFCGRCADAFLLSREKKTKGHDQTLAKVFRPKAQENAA